MNSDPALNTLRTIVDSRGSIERRFVVSALDTNTGEYVPMTQKDTPVEMLAQSAMASGSLPGTF